MGHYSIARAILSIFTRRRRAPMTKASKDMLFWAGFTMLALVLLLNK